MVSSNSLTISFIERKNDPSQNQLNVHWVKRAAHCSNKYPRSPVFFMSTETWFMLALFYTNPYLRKIHFQPKAQNKVWNMMSYEFLSLWNMFNVQPYTSTWICVITLYLPCKCDSILNICLYISLLAFFEEHHLVCPCYWAPQDLITLICHNEFFFF